MCRELIAAGADLDSRDDEGRTALEVAAARGREDLVSILQEAGAGTGGLAEARLLRAAEEGDLACVNALIAEGVNVNTHTPQGHTPLMHAARQGHLEIVRVLLAAGADPRARTEFNYTPLQSAVWMEHTEVVRALIAAGADVRLAAGNPPLSPLENAVARRNAEIVRLLLEAGAAPVPSSTFASPPLHLAISHNVVPIVRSLLEAGADPDVREPHSHSTALHIAAKMGRTDLVRVLLETGADPDAHDESGQTPRQIAERDAGRMSLASSTRPPRADRPVAHIGLITPTAPWFPPGGAGLVGRRFREACPGATGT